jgi:hypothetical protein
MTSCPDTASERAMANPITPAPITTVSTASCSNVAIRPFPPANYPVLQKLQ